MSETGKNGEGPVAGIEMTNLSAGAAVRAPSRQVSKAGNRHSLLELHVCLPDLTHITIMIDQHTQATEIMDMIIDTQGLKPAEARHVLSLWLVSADLELQLKPNHCPTQLFEKWPIYLRKYTELGEKSPHSQKPLVHLRRNVYISRDEDLMVTDVEILELLFTEARCNVMNGTYPCSQEVVVELAGILCAMQYGPYNANEHTPEFYKSVHSILPLSIQSDSKALEEVCNLVAFSHNLSNRIDEAANVSMPRNDVWFKAAYKHYIDKAHTLPYYGSVFFDGYIQRVSKSFLHSSWLPVNIGANTDGIYIISTEKEEPLLGILYEDLTWDYVEMCACTTTNCPHSEESSRTDKRHRVSQKVKASKKDKVTSMPSLLLQYPATPDEQSEGINSQVVRVYTMSARLIDAFIENCSDILKQRLQSPIPSPDVMLAPAGATSGDHVDGPNFTSSLGHSAADQPRSREHLERSIKNLTKPNKLICSSFTKEGKCVSP